MRAPVSLVIATYNRGPRIARTIDSVLAQTEPPVEVVVTDDCSTDGTGEWVRAHYPWVRVVRTPRNLHTSGARNFGAAAATAPILVFLDHDDVLHRHAVGTLVGLLKAFPGARAAFADHRYMNTVSGVTHPDHHTSQPAFHRLRAVPTRRAAPGSRLCGRALFYALLSGNLLQQPWAVYRDTFRALGGFAADVRYCEDWELYLRLTRRFPVALTDEVISDHLVDGENLHLTPNQVGMYRRVLGRVLATEPLNLRVVVPVLRTLGAFAKADGDAARADDPWSAWRAYLRAFACWPLDHVVVARALGVLPLELLRRPPNPNRGRT